MKHLIRFKAILLLGVFVYLFSVKGNVEVFAKGIFTKSVKLLNTEDKTDIIDSQYDSKKQQFMDTISQAYDYVSKNYYKEVDDQNILDGTLQGMMSNLGDPYSTYVTSKEAVMYRESVTGEFGGLGISIDEGLDVESGFHYIKVVAPIEGTPAYFAGIQSGDLIVSVDEQSTANMSSDNAAKIMRGKPGTKVVLTVKRNSKLFTVKITRAIIKFTNVKYGAIDDEISYLSLRGFNDNTPADIAKALKNLDKKGYETLIIDLRSNPGGSLSAVLKIANYFLGEEKLIVGTEARAEVENREYFANSIKLVDDDKNIVVMINSGTASASEILSGAIKFNGRGVLVGEKTFGKGLVQSVNPFQGGFMTLTISQYYTAGRHFINKQGIFPDIEIKDIASELSIEERFSANEIHDRNIVRLFVEEKRGNITESVIKEFQDKIHSMGLSINNKAYIKKLLFLQKSRFGNIVEPYSLEIDSVLRSTVEKIRNKEVANLIQNTSFQLNGR